MATLPAVAAERIAIAKLFPSPVASIALPDADTLNRALHQAILAQERIDAGARHSNDGGWQSRDDFERWSGAPGQVLLETAKAFANQLSAVQDPERGLVHAALDWRFNAWANVNRSGHANAPHSHPGAYWSGVYWVDDGGAGDDPALGGELEFFDPRGAMPAMLAPDLKMRIADCLSAGLSFPMTPRSGTLVLFPSWLTHAVRRFTGDRPRISVAINLTPPAPG